MLGLHLQDPFSRVAQLEAATTAASVSHLRQAKSPPKMQQPRNSHTLSLKVHVSFATMLDSPCSPATSPWPFGFLQREGKCSSIGMLLSQQCIQLHTGVACLI